MKRVGGIFEQVVHSDNLRLAFCRAARGKRHRPEVAAFAAALDARLASMAAGLQAASFPVGRFTQFEIHDPKRRIITAPCFSERVLHHAIMLVCGPHFDRWLVADTYACRPGKGREAAVLRAAKFSRRFAWRVHLDVRQYFDSIPHRLLINRLERRFKDRRLLEVFRGIIAGFRGGLGRGLPIGSLMSQHFANFYLDALDRFVKERLGIAGYVRYMDDIVLWGGTAGSVSAAAEACREFLGTALDLELKPATSGPSVRGLDFLGCRIFPSHAILSRASRRRYGRRVRVLMRAVRLGLLDEAAAQPRLEAAGAFARAAGARSWQFRSAVLNSLAVGDP
jgi:RNA-directed DNA polymerase